MRRVNCKVDSVSGVDTNLTLWELILHFGEKTLLLYIKRGDQYHLSSLINTFVVLELLMDYKND